MQAVEGGNAETAGMGVAFDTETMHMSESRCLFLSHWLRLLALEEAGLPGKRAEIWQLSGEGCRVSCCPPCAGSFTAAAAPGGALLLEHKIAGRAGYIGLQ